MTDQTFINAQIAIAALYIAYALLIRTKVAHRYARLYLLSIFPLSAIIASLKIPFWNAPIVATTLSDATIAAMPTVATQAIEQSTPYLAYIYWIGVAVMGLWLLATTTRVLLLCRSVKPQNGIRYVDKGCAFSFFNAIFISTKYNADDRQAIISHEQCHAKYLHSLDVIYLNLCRAMLWFNPFAWLIFHSARQVHEWQADAYVIKSGVNKIQYIDLLLEAGSTTNTQVVNSINYSLTKKRIIMIAKNQNRSALRLAAALPVLLTLVFCLSLTTKASVPTIDAPIAVIETPTEEPVVMSTQMPKFTKDSEGGIDGFRQWTAANLVYPQSALKNKVQGRVIISFVVEKDGTVTNITLLQGASAELDQAAIDVVAKSPKWYAPGYDKNKAVRFTFNLPIDFRL